MGDKNWMEIDCEVVCDLLPLYHDGVVTEETKQAIEQHLKTCPVCQKEYEDICLELPQEFLNVTKTSRSNFDQMLRKSRRKRFVQLIPWILLLILFAAHLGRKIQNKIYYELVFISGAAWADMHGDLTVLEGEQYEKKQIASLVDGNDKIEVWENKEFLITKDKICPWNESMPKTDPDGNKLSNTYWISVYECQVKITRYLTINSEAVPDSETCKYITYTGYEDRDLNSIARALVDESDRTVTYSDSESYFENPELQIKRISEGRQVKK